MKSLIVLLSLVFSLPAFSAEKITHNGAEGVFLEKEEAGKLLAIVEVELPSLKNQKILLEEEVQKQKELIEITEDRLKVEKEISETWKKAFEASSKDPVETAPTEETPFYVYIGLFVGGTIVGAAIMYGASCILDNT